MLSREENELLTMTGAGTPMGDLIRSYWIPALLTEEIPEPDCPPVRVHLLGEDLVAFRDSQGRIGLLAEHCAHRGTSLYFGRNEDCGLRCIYHGWKYDVDGNVLETPAEPPNSNLRHKVRHSGYPCQEAAGIVFAYLGPAPLMPLFPNYEWTQVPQNQTYVTKCLQECNYLQGLEGECDSAHLSFLHRKFGDDNRALFVADTAPVYECEETDFGVRMVAIRNAGPGQQYIRVSSFVMPVAGCVSARNGGFEIHFYVPADDTHSWRFDLGFKRDRMVREEDLHRRAQIGPDYRRIRNSENRYQQDREAQKSVSFTGIEDFLNHDACATESMGPVFNRSQEHLGSSDQGVIGLRKYLLNAVKTVQNGGEPPHIVRDPEQNRFPNIDSIAAVIPADVHWRQQFTHLR